MASPASAGVTTSHDPRVVAPSTGSEGNRLFKNLRTFLCVESLVHGLEGSATQYLVKLQQKSNPTLTEADTVLHAATSLAKAWRAALGHLLVGHNGK